MFGRGRKLKRSMAHDGKFYGGDDGTIKKSKAGATARGRRARAAAAHTSESRTR